MLHNFHTSSWSLFVFIVFFSLIIYLFSFLPSYLRKKWRHPSIISLYWTSFSTMLKRRRNFNLLFAMLSAQKTQPLAAGAHPSPTWLHFVSAMFGARFCVLGSKATSWHGEFIHANEACTLTSPLSAYGTHTGPLPAFMWDQCVHHRAERWEAFLSETLNQDKTKQKKKKREKRRRLKKSHRMNLAMKTSSGGRKKTNNLEIKKIISHDDSQN